MSELIIRRAEERDLGEIETLEQRCFDVPWSYESLYHDILENKLAFYVVAEIQGQVCGYVGIWKILEEGHITNVAVAPEYRRKHIGQAMLKALISACEGDGIRCFTLEVRESNIAARALYESFDFREEGIRKGYYENGEAAIIMWRKGQ